VRNFIRTAVSRKIRASIDEFAIADRELVSRARPHLRSRARARARSRARGGRLSEPIQTRLISLRAPPPPPRARERARERARARAREKPGAGAGTGKARARDIC